MQDGKASIYPENNNTDGRRQSIVQVLALDLEGTLVADATSGVPRPGLARFLRIVRRWFPRVLVYTYVSEDRFRALARRLATQAKVPPWFAHVEHFKPQGSKDLSQIPGAHWKHVLLVDDREASVHPGQASQWIEIPPFAYPYPPDDRELERLLPILERRLATT